MYLVFAIAATALGRWIESTVANEVLLPNLVTVVLALLAINVQTTAVVAVKLRDLADKHGLNFARSIKEFRLALYEQVGLIALSLVISAFFKTKNGVSFPILECASFFVFFASIHIFIDTAVGLLTCLFPEIDD